MPAVELGRDRMRFSNIGKVTGIVLLLLSMAQSVQARDYKEQFATYGAGEFSCARYSKARKAGDEQENQIRQWLAGYVSAFNLIIGNTYDIFGSTDFDGMIKWLDDRCVKYPKANLSNTVARFTEVVYPYRKQVKPDKKR